MHQQLSEPERSEFLAFANRLADAAAALTLPLFRTPIDVTDKGTSEFDPVTKADMAAEEAMRHMIAQQYPDHSILGEEFGRIEESSAYEWVLDPIDGTRAYISGLPTWGTLIALLKDGTPVLGIIDQPFLKERYAGWVSGAEMNGKSIKSRKCPSLSVATLSTTGTNWFSETERSAFARLEAKARLTRYGYDCYAYGVLAQGFIDVIAEAQLKVMDYMALIPIVQGAGGAVAGWRSSNIGDDGCFIAVGDPAMIKPVQKTLAF